MTDTVPPWLATMRAISGTREYAGGADNPTILAWRDEIARRYPEMAGYCREYTHDSIPWCGLTVAYCMAANGIRPVFGASATERFLWAGAWARFGRRLERPVPGCVMVLTRDGGGHVTLLEAIDGDYYLCRGGNQSDMVNVARYHRSRLTCAVWPADGARGAAADGSLRPAPAVRPAAPDLRRRMAATILSYEARRDGAGRLAIYPLPVGDGGGSYEVAGINDRYHPDEAAALAGLVRAGRYAEAERTAENFIAAYTDGVAGWHAAPGVEFYLRDCCFNRGARGAARILQRAVGAADDGEVGPDTRAALARIAGPELLARLRSAREQYERDVAYRDESSKFWRGLVNRWDKALAAARRFDAEASPDKPATSVPPAKPSTAGKPAQVGLYAAILATIGGVSQWMGEHVFATLAIMALAAIVLSIIFERLFGR
jgi:uncharacterized protein (TIGR02594 family)